MLSDFTPLTKGQYPIFNQYPEFIVEYQSREREKIRLQEMEYLRERQELSAMHAEFVRRQAEQETYYAQQELLQKAEEERRNILAQEEQKLTRQRERLAAMKRELKVKELQLLDASRRRFLKHQQEVKASQIEKLGQEISRKMDLRDQETEAAIQDVEVRQMELEAQRRRLEELLLKEQVETDRRLEEEVGMSLRKAEQADESLIRQLHKPNRNVQFAEASLAEACQQRLNLDWEREVVARLEQVEAEQDRNRETLLDVHWQTEAEERRLADRVKAAAEPTREEVKAQAQFTQQHKRFSPGKTGGLQQRACSSNRLQHNSNGTTEVNLPSTSAALTQQYRTAATPRHQGTTTVCLNSSSPTDSASTNFSLDRGRAQLEDGERELLKEIRELRHKLAARAKGGSVSSIHTVSTPVSQ